MQDGNASQIITFNVMEKNFLIFYTSVDSIKSINATHLASFYKDLLQIWLHVKNKKYLKSSRLRL